MIKKKVNSPSLFSSLADMLDQSHPLYRLADKIDWRAHVLIVQRSERLVKTAPE